MAGHGALQFDTIVRRLGHLPGRRPRRALGVPVAPTALVALVALVAIGLGAATAAAQPARVTTEAAIAIAPGGNAPTIGTLASGAGVVRGETRGAWTAVTFEGWLDARYVGAKLDTFPASLRADGVNLRTAASTDARTVARLRRGAGLSVLERRNGWVKVQRLAWVRAGNLAGNTSRNAAEADEPSRRGVRPVPAGADARPAPAVAVAAGGDTATLAAPDGALVPRKGGADLRTAPNGRPLAALRDGAAVAPLARERGWVRVRLEGWVREEDLIPADTALRTDVSAADLRADPEGVRGTVVRWKVSSLGLQRAEGLRRELADGEPYLLARGPEGEDALLYLAVPPSLLEDVRRLPALATLLVTARVRTGRSTPTGVPILDLLAVSRP